jgi:hypothetical protein
MRVVVKDIHFIRHPTQSLHSYSLTSSYTYIYTHSLSFIHSLISLEQAPSERNYHIFYHLLLGTTPEEKRKYQLLPIEKVRTFREVINCTYSDSDSDSDCDSSIA